MCAFVFSRLVREVWTLAKEQYFVRTYMAILADQERFNLSIINEWKAVHEAYCNTSQHHGKDLTSKTKIGLKSILIYNLGFSCP